MQLFDSHFVISVPSLVNPPYFCKLLPNVNISCTVIWDAKSREMRWVTHIHHTRQIKYDMHIWTGTQ